MSKRIYIDPNKLQPGQPVLVRNSSLEEWKIKIFSDEVHTGTTMYQCTHPYRVHNKTNTERTFCFKQCIPVPHGLLPVLR